MSLWIFGEYMYGYVVGSILNKTPITEKEKAWPGPCASIDSPLEQLQRAVLPHHHIQNLPPEACVSVKKSYFVGKYWLHLATTHYLILFRWCFNLFKSVACSSTLALSTTFASSSSGQSKRQPSDNAPTHACTVVLTDIH